MTSRTSGPLARRALGLAAAGLIAATGLVQAQTQPQTQPQSAAASYPNRPIRIVVPFAAGGGVDTVSRPLAQALSGILGQPVVVDNRPGAAGNIGMEHVAEAPPDGYTILHSNSGILVTNPILYNNTRARPSRDLVPVGQVTTDPLLYIVPASLPVKNLQEFVAYARARPGQVSFASGGAGGVTHLVGELFALRAGLQLIHVPYRGAAPALTDLIAGRVQLMFDTLGLVQSHQGANSIRLLAIATPQRLPALPDLPTAAEAGVPGAEVNSWQALLVPARTDPAIVAKLTAALKQALSSPELLRLYAERGFVPQFNPPEVVRANMESETATWTEVIRKAEIKLE
jgi:tripartite-type tricarboxylate transporter receptor subunit TctC